MPVTIATNAQMRAYKSLRLAVKSLTEIFPICHKIRLHSRGDTKAANTPETKNQHQLSTDFAIAIGFLLSATNRYIQPISGKLVSGSLATVPLQHCEGL